MNRIPLLDLHSASCEPTMLKGLAVARWVIWRASLSKRSTDAEESPGNCLPPARIGPGKRAAVNLQAIVKSPTFRVFGFTRCV